jgi:Zn-dependent protease
MPGSFRLFQVAGISVYLHWTWLLAAFYFLQTQADRYHSQAWNVAAYVTLFGIVLLHEFGHALACRQVGGQADRIVLWPLGGIAYVRAPARPGALLWSIAAGPLVNVALVPLTFGLVRLAEFQGWNATNADAYRFLGSTALLNLALLIFNLIPIYPLDGGQILQALLWFILGRAKSLLVTSVIGMVAGVGVIALAVLVGDWWLGLLAAFVALRSWAGFQQARLLAQLARAPRHQDAACPSCRAHPLLGEWWACNQCNTRFDTFTHHAVCPGCGKQFPESECADCLRKNPIEKWFGATPQPPTMEGREPEPV